MPAKQVVDNDLLAVLCIKRKVDPDRLTLSEFTMEVAKMGGFIGRKSDGYPGWQTLHAGLMKLLAMVEGYSMDKRCG